MIGFCAALSQEGKKANFVSTPRTDDSRVRKTTDGPAELDCIRARHGGARSGHCDVMRRGDYRLRTSKTINVGTENGKERKTTGARPLVYDPGGFKGRVVQTTIVFASFRTLVVVCVCVCACSFPRPTGQSSIYTKR